MALFRRTACERRNKRRRRLKALALAIERCQRMSYEEAAAFPNGDIDIRVEGELIHVELSHLETTEGYAHVILMVDRGSLLSEMFYPYNQSVIVRKR